MGFEPGISATEVWCPTNEPPHLHQWATKPLPMSHQITTISVIFQLLHILTQSHLYPVITICFTPKRIYTNTYAWDSFLQCSYTRVTLLYSHCPSLHFRNSLLPKKHSVKLLNHHPVQQYMWRCANHTKPKQILPCFLQYSLEMQQSCNLVAEIFATATWELRKIGQGSVCLPYLLQRANCIYKTFKKISF